ncbi:MAG TPA: DUF937 domain-containing protein, partial [Kofleriaceae bacterium]
MTTLTESIQSILTPQLYTALAARLGIAETTTRAGLSTATSAIVNGLAANARNVSAMDDLVELVDRTPEADDPISVIDAETPIRSSGTRLLRHATNDTAGMTDRLARQVGVRRGVAAQMLGAAAGIVLSGLRRFARVQGGVDAAALSTALTTEQPTMRAALPAETPAGGTWRRHRSDVVVRERPARDRWIWLVALAPIVLLGVWLLGDRARDNRDEPAPMGKVSETATEPSRETVNEPPTEPTPAEPPTQQAQPTTPAEPPMEPAQPTTPEQAQTTPTTPPMEPTTPSTPPTEP